MSLRHSWTGYSLRVNQCYSRSTVVHMCAAEQWQSQHSSTDNGDVGQVEDQNLRMKLCTT